MKKLFPLAAMALCLMLIASCGYNFRGKQNNLPSDVRTVAVPVFQNQTGEVRIERIFTDAVIFQFTKSQMLRVVPEARADAVIYGIIKRVEITDVAYTAQETSRQRRVTIDVDARLVRSRDSKVLWQDKRLTQNRTYNVGSTPQNTEQLKRTAITELADDMAQTLHDRILENF